jgi:hypothetical protein
MSTRTPIIVTSASLAPKDRALGASAGMDDWYFNLPPPRAQRRFRFNSLLTCCSVAAPKGCRSRSIGGS